MPTTSPLTRPTLLLLFATPQRIPPVRLSAALASNVDVPFGYRRSRSEQGEYADGIFLRAVDARSAVRKLVDAGTAEVRAPATWIAGRRPHLADQTISVSLRGTSWLRRMGNAAMVVGWASAVLGQALASWLRPLGFGVLGLGLAVTILAGRLARRSRQS